MRRRTHVNNRSESHCSDNGTGSQAIPYCTVSAAAKVVKPGQTVLIDAQTTYTEPLTIDRSGEPITFAVAREGVGEHNAPSPAYLKRSLTISGASHVVVRGLSADEGLYVDNSHDVTLDRVYGYHTADDTASLVVRKESTDVRAGRSYFAAVRVEGGAQRTVLSRNSIHGFRIPPVSVVNAPGTVITNNTLKSSCGAGISVGGSSTGSALFNNLL
ncbi:MULTISPECIES: hypothetical protein [unclassified Streptomyces]|uniref:hypothetical protein n=1 Tax=unclassified Streptomyces TaxID=2593676 RepID=UPI000DC760D0|nr:MULTISPECIES: hypothetical protein [unclassified Streptomyces]AWZ08957.1 hypothetical protein DRB89_35525 [Streptomyces sp. ICC4]AWZ16723.1 hypothetical protein DRB96_36095 [Streptomyces sp. ICC1]